MKLTGKLALGCGAVILFFITAIIIFGMIIYFKSDNWTAKSPERICKEVGFKLPSYTVVEKENNMDRGSSAWSWYSWRIKLKKPLSEKDIHQLEKLVKEDTNWKGSRNDFFEYKNYNDYWDGGYDVEIDSSISPQIYIAINSSTDISIKYTWYDAFF